MSESMDDAQRWETLGVNATRDEANISADWKPLRVAEIHGVNVRDVASVVTDNGYLTELWRADWGLDSHPVSQVFQRVINAGAVSAWHVHLSTTDRLSCASGDVLVVLYDARLGSTTYQHLAEYRMGEHHPLVVSIPPGVVHGVKAIGSGAATIVNAVDHAYVYDAPDHYRLPLDSPNIPYRFR